MSRFLSCIVLCSLVTGCCANRETRECLRNPSEQQLDNINYQALTDLIFSYGHLIRQEKHIELARSYTCFDKKVRTVHLDFVGQQLLELQQGRELLVDIVDGLLSRINFNMELYSVFAHRPLSADDIEVTIRFENFFGYFVDPNYLGYISLKDGVASYHNFAFYDGVRVDVHGCKHEQYSHSRQEVAIEREASQPYSEELLAPPPRPVSKERYYRNGFAPAKEAALRANSGRLPMLY